MFVDTQMAGQLYQQIADQFGEQTYIKRGKGSGGTKGISTSPEQVTVWVNSFSVCSHLNIAVEDMYEGTDDKETPRGEKDKSLTRKHKEEGEARRKLDEDDRGKIAEALGKCTHPLTEQHAGVYNICNGLVAHDNSECARCPCHWDGTKQSIFRFIKQ